MKIILLILAMFYFLNTSLVNAAGIQKWIDEQGRSHYGERPPSNQKADGVKNRVSVVKVVASKPMVILYSTSRCGYCKKAKAFMDEESIDYREYFIDKNVVANADFKKMGGQGVPLLVKEDRTLRGFNRRSYQQFFGLR
jgi:glutaredoxin